MIYCEVIPTGTKVKINGDVDGTILQIGIRHSKNVGYEVGWWNGKDYRKEWFEAFQIESGKRSVKIGFAEMRNQ